jgi:hypothetical protein
MFAALFSPPQAAMGQYEVCTSTEGIDTVLGHRQSDGPRFTVSEAEALNPLDAFGAGGTYRRSKLARLYSGGRATVVRGWRQTGGTFESITLISPFPDVTLSRLMPGTMEIRFTYNFVLRQ